MLFPRRTGRASVDVGDRTWPVFIDQESTHFDCANDLISHSKKLKRGFF
ncbi:hypothetical protein [Alteribacillus sp. HJP-4]